MITTTMNSEEIIKEYKKDYKNCIKPRLVSISSRKSHDLKILKGKWYKSPEITIKSDSGNSYKIKCQFRWDKKLGFGWNYVAYLPSLDSRTGQNVVYIMSDSFPIKLSPSFLKEIKTSVSDFLGYGTNWDILFGDDYEEKSRYSSYINFGEGIGAGVGGWESGIFVLRHLVKTWKEDPLKDFLESREKKEEKEKSEIDLAWEAYLQGNLDPI